MENLKLLCHLSSVRPVISASWKMDFMLFNICDRRWCGLMPCRDQSWKCMYFSIPESVASFGTMLDLWLLLYAWRGGRPGCPFFWELLYKGEYYSRDVNCAAEYFKKSSGVGDSFSMSWLIPVIRMMLELSLISRKHLIQSMMLWRHSTRSHPFSNSMLNFSPSHFSIRSSEQNSPRTIANRIENRIDNKI